jgi:UDP-N-acetyl-D-mannosaminuronate dehydrogenase
VIERVSGLRFNEDFFAGYSPERINPGDKVHRLTSIKKITSGSTPEVADTVDALYRTIITAGTHKTSSIRVLEGYGAEVDVYDPWADASEAEAEYGVRPVAQPVDGQYDAIMLAVAHREFYQLGAGVIHQWGKPEHVLYDLKYVLPADQVDLRL